MLLGLLLLDLGIPRAIGHGALLATHATRAALSDPGEPVPDQAALVALLREQSEWAALAPSASYRRAEALAHLAMGDLKAAAQGLQHTLSATPGGSGDWALLAALAERGALPIDIATAAFSRAVATEGFSSYQTPNLFRLGLRLWPVMNAQQRQDFNLLTARQWAWGPGRLTEITIEERAEALVVLCLPDDAAVHADFQHRLAALLPEMRPGLRN